jgi:cation diffusion facilitator CzcD-associated flavoprotein CzcO
MPVQKYTRYVVSRLAFRTEFKLITLSSAPEILAYCDLVARQFDLYEGALFSTHVTELKWNDAIARWEVRTNRGDLVKARWVVSSVGNLTRAKVGLLV